MALDVMIVSGSGQQHEGCLLLTSEVLFVVSISEDTQQQAFPVTEIDCLEDDQQKDLLKVQLKQQRLPSDLEVKTWIQFSFKDKVTLMMMLLATGILTFGWGGQRSRCQTRRPAVFMHLIADCVALWMKGMCLLPSVLLLIVTFHIWDSNFLREKLEEVSVLSKHHLFSEEILTATCAWGVYCLASQHCCLCLQSHSENSSFYSSVNSVLAVQWCWCMLLSACFLSCYFQCSGLAWLIAVFTSLALPSANANFKMDQFLCWDWMHHVFASKSINPSSSYWKIPKPFEYWGFGLIIFF